MRSSLKTGSTDGTLNIPVADPTDYSDPKVALNALDGFSPIAPWSTTFNMPVDSASLVGGQTVRMFEVAFTDPGVLSVSRPERRPKPIRGLAMLTLYWRRQPPDRGG